MNSEISDAGHCLTLRRIRKILDGEIACGEQFFDCTVNSACGRNLIGDTLAFTRHISVLLKCLTNSQAIRTAIHANSATVHITKPVDKNAIGERNPKPWSETKD